MEKTSGQSTFQKCEEMEMRRKVEGGERMENERIVRERTEKRKRKRERERCKAQLSDSHFYIIIIWKLFGRMKRGGEERGRELKRTEYYVHSSLM